MAYEQSHLQKPRLVSYTSEESQGYMSINRFRRPSMTRPKRIGAKGTLALYLTQSANGWVDKVQYPYTRVLRCTQKPTYKKRLQNMP